MPHIRGAPYRPMTQGKIERWHPTLKNRILLENYYLPRPARGSDRSLRRPLQSPALRLRHRPWLKVRTLAPAAWALILDDRVTASANTKAMTTMPMTVGPTVAVGR